MTIDHGCVDDEMLREPVVDDVRLNVDARRRL
jgi:hypothetical protein